MDVERLAQHDGDLLVDAGDGRPGTSGGADSLVRVHLQATLLAHRGGRGAEFRPVRNPVQTAGTVLEARVVQLVGALGAQNSVYDGHGLVQRLAAKFNSKAYYLNAPFLVNDQAVAQALEDTPSIRSVIELGEACDLALLGIGSLKAANSSFLQAGYVSLEDFEKLKEHRMVGDICGRHFTITGEILDIEFHHRIIAITPQALKNIPLRIAVAGGPHKAIPILGALRSGLLNVLVTNESTAQQIVNYS